MQRKLNNLTKALSVLLKCDALNLFAGFRPALKSDFEAIITFREKNLGGNLDWNDREYFYWRYEFKDVDDFGDNFQYEFPQNRVWILKLGQNIVGMLGIVEMPISANGEELKVGHPLDILVDQSMDGLGIGAWMKLVIDSKYETMLIIGANKNSQSMVKRMFHPLPNREMWKLALDATFVYEKFNFPASMSRILGFLTNPFLRGYRTLKWQNYYEGKYKVCEIESFVEDVFSLSEGWNENVYLRKRKSEYLNKRFFACPTKNFQAFGLFSGDKLLAYLVFHINEGRFFTKRAEIVDFFWRDPKSEEAANQLLMLMFKFLEIMTAKSVKVVQVVSYGKYPRDILKKAGFVLRADESLLISISNNKGDAYDFLYNSEYWFLTDADAHGAGV